MNPPIRSLAVLLLIVPQLLLAQAAPEPPLVTVTGTAEVKVVPDLVVLTVGVQASAAKLDTARADYDTHIRAALEVLKQQGVADADVATSYLDIRPEYDRDRSGAHTTAYVFTQHLTVRLHDVSKADPVLAALLKAGINVVDGVSYETSELRKHRDTARQMAVKAAQEKADALTSELGAKRGKVYRIREVSDHYDSYGNRSVNSQTSIGANAIDALLVGGVAGSTLAAGQISISASIEVAFLIE